MTRTIGIIGVGEIAGAIVDGLCGGLASPEVYLSPRGATVRPIWRLAIARCRCARTIRQWWIARRF